MSQKTANRSYLCFWMGLPIWITYMLMLSTVNDRCSGKTVRGFCSSKPVVSTKPVLSCSLITYLSSEAPSYIVQVLMLLFWYYELDKTVVYTGMMESDNPNPVITSSVGCKVIRIVTGLPLCGPWNFIHVRDVKVLTMPGFTESKWSNMAFPIEKGFLRRWFIADFICWFVTWRCSDSTTS